MEPGEMIGWTIENSDKIFTVLAYLISAASVIVKLTPTLEDDHFMKKLIKFLGKYVALDKYGPPRSE
jgi:hypothetical protein